MEAIETAKALEVIERISSLKVVGVNEGELRVRGIRAEVPVEAVRGYNAAGQRVPAGLG